ncbi:transcriptional regulator, LacI family [Beutenbergia cavernae DSM 12333]|uniref:Transcriptional regulator, LacI family n=1 Tax=Beutenbergia cavernae (strain ATCC BAA-8 / DSM 12333 / CCUG 43141 / JCM 11478 / NBRC 16432 / NCIMB 13614 / HKI 0122) TaxID=471853 RepID=C5BYX1_BEUC1|nr:LacI family DNA-binding transcriptional regulator [Beutenbergia cavernae]ACQ81086.1 transcriptional regulator, LacI family [Beutenbergia cavernae DSM 12333]
MDKDMAGTDEGRRTAPTLVEVARLAGVSRATASRALNGGLRVSPEAMDAVRRAVAELGYSPNRAARSLVTRRTDSIAVVVPESDDRVFSDPFFAVTLRGVTSALAATDIQAVLLVGQGRHDVGRVERYLRGGHTDGAIVVSHHQADTLAVTLREIGLPSVYVGRPLAPDADVPYVDVDNVAGARLAVEHLIAQGRRRIGLIAGPQDMSAGVDRLAGWRTALAAAGLDAPEPVVADFTLAGGAAAADRLMAAHPELDAVFAASDRMAAGALPIIAAHGRNVPDDVAVIGYDDLELASQTHPPLTTVVNPVIDMATRAVHMVLDQIAGRDVASPVLLTTHLVLRRSA